MFFVATLIKLCNGFCLKGVITNDFVLIFKNCFSFRLFGLLFAEARFKVNELKLFLLRMLREMWKSSYKIAHMKLKKKEKSQSFRALNILRYIAALFFFFSHVLFFLIRKVLKIYFKLL